MKAVVVLDGTRADTGRQARALAGFLRDGLRGDHEAETLLLAAAAAEPERLLPLAPTRAVRLVRAASRLPAHLFAALRPFITARDAPALIVFAAGPAGSELAARLAAQTSGSVLTGVLDAEVLPDGVVCRAPVYSGHLVRRVELTRRPVCLVLDASWDEAEAAPAADSRILSAHEAPASAGDGPLTDVAFVAADGAGDLATSRVVVVAGRGAGGRDGVRRIAAAAARMGAAFGVTRPVAMNAWAATDRLIGASGARVAPAVCIVAGASGSPAFMWGVEKSGHIIAVDTDERAPIVKQADEVVIGDAVTTLEALAEEVARRVAG
jgi:electron transfer flavoprotein alpha subunit